MSNNIHFAPSCRIISVFVGVKRFVFQSLFFYLYAVVFVKCQNKICNVPSILFLINSSIILYLTYFLLTLHEL